MLIWKSLAALGLISRVALADVYVQEQPLNLDSNMFFESFNEGVTGHLVAVNLNVDYTTYGLITIENPTDSPISVPLVFSSTIHGALLGPDGVNFAFADGTSSTITIAPHSIYQTTSLIAQGNYNSNLDPFSFMNADHLRAFNFSQLISTQDGMLDISVSNVVTEGLVTLTYHYTIPVPSVLVLGMLGSLYLLRRKQ